MGMKSSLILGAVGIAVIAGAAYWYAGKPKTVAMTVPIATPAGVTFQTVKMGKVTYVPGSSSDQQAELTVFADAKGITLYTFDKDQPGKSVCDGECAKYWTAFAAAADAKPVGDWSIIDRADGSKQWAFQGKPLYTFIQDKKVGSYAGNGLADNTWHIAFAQPAAGMVLPVGLAVTEVAEAGGQAMVDSRGMPVYMFDGDVRKDKAECGQTACPGSFVPLVAGLLANPVGDFTLVSRDDGRVQWAYKGRALYTYDGDVDLGDANGMGVDGRYQIAMISKYFIPAGVVIRPDERRGGLLTTADGKTLYARDKLIFDGTGAHYGRGHVHANPMIGMGIGTSGCDAECEKTWIPLRAPADAQASGYWSVVDRADGTKQWAYQHFPLYSFTGDKKPGDTIGNESYDLTVNDAPQKVADATPGQNMVLDHGLGLYWRVTTP